METRWYLSYHFSGVVHLSWPRTLQVGQAGWAVNPRSLAVTPYHQDYRHTHSTCLFFFFFKTKVLGIKRRCLAPYTLSYPPRAKICPTSPYCSVGIKLKLSCLACDLPGSGLLAHYRGSLHTLHTDTQNIENHVVPTTGNHTCNR